jgi:hypothetical protein
MNDRHTLRVTPPELISPGVYRIGDIIVSKAERSISFPAVINMNSGLLEYLLVRSGGKTHESLFRTQVEPYNLQIACLLLDLVGTDKPLPFQGAPDVPKGDQLAIKVSYKDKDGMVREVFPEKWIARVVDEKQYGVVDRLKWTFVGSWIYQGRFMAQVEGSIVALYHDPVAIIDNASPGGEIHNSWFVNEKNVPPPVGTQVTITIKPAKRP